MFDLTATIVTYKNELPILRQTIESLNNAFPKVQIVIFDNSLDKEYFSLLKSELCFKNVLFIDSKENKGFGAGHNMAENFCNESKYHLILNPDVIVNKNTLYQIIDYMNANTRIGVISPKILNSDLTFQYSNKRYPTLIALILRRIFKSDDTNIPYFKRKLDYYLLKDIDHAKDFDPPLLSGCFMVFQREVFRAISGFDENFFLYFEDFDICLRVKEHGYRVSYLSSASCIHLWERGNSYKTKHAYNLVKSMIIFYKKWGLKLT